MENSYNMPEVIDIGCKKRYDWFSDASRKSIQVKYLGLTTIYLITLVPSVFSSIS